MLYSEFPRTRQRQYNKPSLSETNKPKNKRKLKGTKKGKILFFTKMVRVVF